MVQYKLLFFKPYEFVNDKTGEVVKGAKIALLGNEPLTEDNYLGYPVEITGISSKISDELSKNLKDVKLPCDVEVDLQVSLSGKSKIVGINVI